jgi:hypothetical protein
VVGNCHARNVSPNSSVTIQASQSYVEEDTASGSIPYIVVFTTSEPLVAGSKLSPHTGDAETLFMKGVAIIF